MANTLNTDVLKLARKPFDPAKEHLTAVAIKIDYDPEKGIYIAMAPKRHGDLIREMIEQHGCTAPVGGIQGFWTSKSRFVDRAEALRLAEEAGQIKRYTSYGASELFSEDVW